MVRNIRKSVCALGVAAIFAVATPAAAAGLVQGIALASETVDLVPSQEAAIRDTPRVQPTKIQLVATHAPRVLSKRVRIVPVLGTADVDKISEKMAQQ